MTDQLRTMLVRLAETNFIDGRVEGGFDTSVVEPTLKFVESLITERVVAELTEITDFYHRPFHVEELERLLKAIDDRIAELTKESKQ